MYEKAKKDTIVFEILVLSIVVITVFAILIGYSYARMISQVNNNLDAAVNAPGSLSMNEIMDNQGLDKGARHNFLVIYFNRQTGKYQTNDKAFFTKEEIEQVIRLATKERDRLIVNGNRIAYRTIDRIEDGNSYYIYIYDYSINYEQFKSTTIVRVVSLVFLILIMTFFIIEFNKMFLSPIEETIEKQKELIQNASHELKTPITIINTNLEILNDSNDNLTPEQKDWLNSISLQTQRMSSLVNEMLELAKFDNNKNILVETVDFSSIVESVALETEVLAFEKKIKFTFNIDKDIKISANVSDIEHLIYTLVENAVKYTPENGEITMTLDKNKQKNKTSFKIKNTGLGIEKEKLPKIFDRFYRTDEAHSDGKSFGLGLAIAKSITERYKGTIQVESKEGEYTTFTVMFKAI